MKTLLLLLPVMLMAIPIAAASYISIQSSITATGNETLIKVTNFGDEAAYNVQLSLDINNKKTASDVKRQLGVRESFEWAVPLNFESKNPGKYPLILTTNYEDANSYPFSAISVSALDYKQATISDIATAMSNIKLSDKGIFELKIKNIGETAKDASIRLIAPKELTVDKDRLSMNLLPQTEKTISFGIEKFSALAGSSYVVFAVIEYEENNKHYTSMTSGLINVVESKSIFTNEILLVAVLIVLAAAFIYFQFKKRK